jgi:hypothetical protein
LTLRDYAFEMRNVAGGLARISNASKIPRRGRAYSEALGKKTCPSLLSKGMEAPWVWLDSPAEAEGLQGQPGRFVGKMQKGRGETGLVCSFLLNIMLIIKSEFLNLALARLYKEHGQTAREAGLHGVSFMALG